MTGVDKSPLASKPWKHLTRPGAASLAWLAPWMIATRGEAAAAAQAEPSIEAPTFRALFGRREPWGAALGMFAYNYPYFLVLFWLPLYLVKARAYSLAAMAELAGWSMGSPPCWA